MKIKTLLTAVAAVFLFQSAFGQGALTPPGAPAAAMKSLDQIYTRTDARTPITNSASLVTISQPGSYYLTGNLTVSTGDGIDIATNGVTLDLNGFTIASTATSATGTGVKFNGGLWNITIVNGFIQGGVTNNGSGVYSGGGFAYGVLYSGTTPQNVLVSHVSVAGCLDYGIYLYYGNSTVVEACTVRTVGSYGIFASTIKSCSAMDCGGTGIYCDEVADSRGQCSGSGIGLYATTAQNCYGSSSGNIGLESIQAINCYGNTATGYAGLSVNNAENCYGFTYGSGYGIYTVTAQSCYGHSSGSIGIYVTYGSAINCYGDSSSGIGLSASTAAYCIGSRPGGTAIQSYLANGCIAAYGTNIITYKYNMP